MVIRTYHPNDNKSGRRFAAPCSAFRGMTRCLLFLPKSALRCAERLVILVERPVFAQNSD